MSFAVSEVRELVRLCGGSTSDLIPRGYVWSRLFVNNSKGVQIGRVTFKDGNLEGFTSYKSYDYRDIDETDLIFFRLSYALNTGKIMPEADFWVLWEEAKKEVKADFEEKLAWRRANPPSIDKRTGKRRKRKKLMKKNPRAIMQRLIREKYEEQQNV